MSKINIICTKCGKVQIRTDIIEEISDNYITLDKKIKCPKCDKETVHIATKNVQVLRNQLEKNPNHKLDSYILKLIKK